MRQKNLLGQIRNHVSRNIIAEPFQRSDFPFLINSKSFLSKHAVGNGKYNEYFIRIRRGYYTLKGNL